jgi:hypothetical protein
MPTESQLISTSLISGNSFSRDAANKAAIKTYRQKMATISAMINNILNMIDSQPISKNNSRINKSKTISVFFLNYAKNVQKFKSHFVKWE